MNGREAVDKVKQRMDRGEAPYDLIFMDIHMPEMDGIEAATIITDLHIGTPIVAITAETRMFIEDNAYSSSGMSSCLRKPFTTQEMWRCLLKYLQPANNGIQHTPECTELVEDKELLKELKFLFAAGNKDTIKNITVFLEHGNMKDAHMLVHTLKSSALIIGKSRLSNIAKEVEHLLKHGHLPNPELIKELISELRLVLDELAP
jgi:CheY-like chemotaxis protein